MTHSSPAAQWVATAAFALLGLGPARVTTAAGAAPLIATHASPRWSDERGWSPQARELIAILQHVEEYGLTPADFAGVPPAFDGSGGGASPTPAAEEALGAAALRLARQLHDGRIDPRAAGYELRRRRASLDPVAALGALAGSADVRATLATFEPRARQYHALKDALARYRGLPTDLLPLPSPGRVSLRAGENYAGAPPLRRLLAALGDEPPPAPDDGEAPLRFDAGLSAALARFQSRHGLEADGVLGPRTFAALSVPPARRVRQIELTLERWRWLPDIPAPAVIVNVPQFVLYSLPDPYDPAGVIKLPVIVGKTGRQTPVFDSQIEAVEFRPYWNVPDSILRQELLPKIVRDPGYLARNDLEIVRRDGAGLLEPDAAGIAALRSGRARLRQRPGPSNALGTIKFLLPNPYDVYLHSTSDPQLFSRERRALSHGCIRVSDTSALAAFLLKDTPGGWDADTIEAATCGDRTFTVKLAKPVPVFILYGTVVVDLDGRVLFFEDLYGFDQRLERLLLARPRGR